MRVHVFSGSGGVYGFTPEAFGNNLPQDQGPWRPFKAVMMYREYPANRIGVAETDGLDVIQRDGYYVTAEKIVWPEVG